MTATRPLTTLLITLTLLAGGLHASLSTLGAPTASAATRAMPGSFTGYGFDTCDAPSQRAMDAWRRTSKYAAVGIYIAGMNRACATQTHLDARWVARQSRRGWRLLPLVVGRQAACSPPGYYVGKRISKKERNDYGKARQQGRGAATAAVAASRGLGIGRRSVLWFDLEHFDISKRRCRQSALAFLSAWTRRLHGLGYRSGVYSSASSGIRMLDDARRRTPARYALPDQLWIAEWNGRAGVRSDYIGTGGWWPHRRVHQYRGGHDERHGGVRLRIDSNYLSVGGGSRPGKEPRHCGVRISFRDYRRLSRGDRGPQVKAAQCLLRQEGRYAGKVSGRFTKATARAVRAHQRRHPPLDVNGVMNQRTWTSVHATGPSPLLKFGSAGNGVRRLQRALNAAGPRSVRVSGVFARPTRKALRAYQRSRGVPRNGVVTDGIWRQLRKGRR